MVLVGVSPDVVIEAREKSQVNVEAGKVNCKAKRTVGVAPLTGIKELEGTSVREIDTFGQN